MISFLLDIAVVGTVVFCGWRGFKSGLIRGVFGVVSLIVALFIANIAAQAYSEEATAMLRPFVSGTIESAINDMSDEGIEYQALAHDHELDDADFGTAYTVLRHLGLPEAAAVNIAERSLSIDDTEQHLSFADIIGRRLSSVLSYVAVFGVAFLLVSIVFAVIGNLVGLVFALPGLKLVDMIAGSALGLFKGIIIVYSAGVIIRYFGLFVLPTIEGTTLLRNIVNNNPIANILGI